MRTLRVLFLSVVLVVLCVPALPVNARDSSFRLDRLETFLDERIPHLTGTITRKDNGVYFAEVNGNDTEGPVTVHRRIMRRTGSGRRLVEKPLGTGRVHPHEPGVVRLELPPSLEKKVRLGDKIRRKRIDLSVRNRTNLPRRRIRSVVGNTPGVDRINFVDPGDVPKHPYLLTITSDRFRITRTKTGTVLARTGSSRSPRGPGGGQPPGTLAYLRDVHRFRRTVNDFEWISLPARGKTIDLLLLASSQSLGFARFTSEVRNLRWKTLRGNVLDVSLVGVPKNQPGKLVLLVVTEDDETIRSSTYTFNVLESTLNRQWTARDVWIRRVGGNRFIAQKIGRNSPFSASNGFVTVTRQGWDWTESSREGLSSALVPPAVASGGDYFTYLEPSGSLAVTKQGKTIVRTPEEFAGGALRVEATRGNKSVSLHPEFGLTVTENGIRILLPQNIASGFTMVRSLTSYKESRLTLLEVSGQSTETLWESERLSGYVSGTEWGGGSFWSMSVNPKTGRSQLRRLHVEDAP